MKFLKVIFLLTGAKKSLGNDRVREYYGLQPTQTKTQLEPPLKHNCTLWLHEL